jgi:cytochrome c-type biogenesis protein CcmI
MSWPLFYFVVVGLVIALILVVSLPWIRVRNQNPIDQLRNAQIVKQRLVELEREADEGLISEADKQQAIDELKIALVEESNSSSENQTSTSHWAILTGLTIALAIAVPVYYQANHIAEVKQLATATESVAELSEKLIAVANGEAEITPEEMQMLTLAIRQRLRQSPEDSQAWLNLGRLYLSIGFSEQSVQSFEKAFQLAPEDPTTRLNFAQSLMLSGTDEHLQRAKRLLAFELEQQPGNDNVLLMLTVVTVQLGELDVAENYFAQIATKLSPQSQMYQTIVARLDELRGRPSNRFNIEQPQTDQVPTGFAVTVSIDETLRSQLPEQGFLFVFAQDANSQMRMPAAVVKLPLTELPVTVQLTEQNAMVADYNLLTINQARLVARISEDENVEAANGELQGMTEFAVKPGHIEQVIIILNQEIQ